jgi:hypothetical protein
MVRLRREVFSMQLYHALHAAIDTGRASTKQGTLARLGEAVLLMQDVESMFRSITLYVIQKKRDGPLDLAAWEAQTAAEEKKTLGYFLSQLRCRVAIEPVVDAILSTFLERRNDLIHHLENVPGWGLEDDTSLRVSNDFLTAAMASAKFVYFWLGGIMASYQRQTGFTTEFDDAEAIGIVERHFMPLAEWSLSRK